MTALTTTGRGLGWKHQTERRRLLPGAYGQPCPFWGTDPLCVGVMLRGQALDLDHAVPRALGGDKGPRRIAHAACNRRAGARLGRRLARARAVATRSRDW